MRSYARKFEGVAGWKTGGDLVAGRKLEKGRG